MTTLIIPAAGRASRLRPLSNNMSKAMVPVAGKPIISHILDQYGKDYDQIVVVYGENNDLPIYIRLKYPEVILAKQDETLGPLHAIWCGMGAVELDDGPLTIWLGDTIVTDFVTPIVSPGESIVIASEVDDWSRWCMIDTEGKLYDKPTEKPENAAALVGIYCLPCFSEAFDLTDEVIQQNYRVKNEYQISQLLEKYHLIYELTEHWFDCGELHSLYESNAALISNASCADNSIMVDVDTCTLIKCGTRCTNEIYWYNHIPTKAKPFIPNIYDLGKDFVKMEFISGTTLQNMLVYEDLTVDAVEFLMKRVFMLYHKCFFEYGDDMLIQLNDTYEDMWITKNIRRVAEYQYEFTTQTDIAHYIEKTLAVKSELAKNIKYRSFVHGDFHLGNLLFNPGTSQIKMIDPRGERNGIRTITGDNLYDIVKLYQSIYGEYIWIHSGVPKNELVYTAALNTLDEYFSNFCDVGLIKKLVPIMMGSVLSFHSNDEQRQQRIWNKAIELL